MPLESTVEGQHRYVILRWLLSAAIAMIFLLFIFVIVLEIQIQKQNKQVDEIYAAAQVTHQASIDTRDELRNIISQVNSPQAQEAARLSRDRLLRIENKLCGGPCPTTPER